MHDEDGEDVSEGEDDEDSAVDEVDETESAELRKKIEEALKINGVERAEDSDSGSSSEEELLDDDQMMQFDEKLAEVFRLRKNEKSGKGPPFCTLLTSFRLNFRVR